MDEAKARGLSIQDAMRAAAREQDPEKRLARLAELVAWSDLGLIETVRVGNLIEYHSGELPGFPEIRLLLLSSCTVEHLVPAIRVAGLRRRMLVRTHVAAYGQYRQILLSLPDNMRTFAPSHVLLSIDSASLLGELSLSTSHSEADAGLAAAVEQLRELWRVVREELGATVVQQTFLDVHPPIFGSHDRLVPASPGRLVRRLNEAVADAALADGALLLDVEAASARDGIDDWFDRSRWLQARMEIAPQAAPRYGELLGRVLGAQLGRSRKCLVLDLDNTLWGGEIGELGLEGIALGEGSALGEAHLALQRYARRLSERGVILAVCSKNEQRIVEEAFDEHPEMHLRRSDVSALVANWNDKAKNLCAIADRLDIGLDTLVFVDDSPAERARVREALPMVAVPELSEDPALWVDELADAGYFEATSFTVEDRERTRQYADNAERASLREAAQSVEEFLAGLDMSVSYGPVEPVHLVRATQLLNKTNQFNATTIRMTREELVDFLNAPGHLGLQFRLTDRFGDNGLVSVLLLRPAPDDPTSLEIFNWVMSCRVFGRGLEDEILNIVVEAAREHDAKGLRGKLIPTASNAMIGNLYERLGFTLIGEDESGQSGWSLPAAGYVPRRTAIRRRYDGDG